MGSADEGGPRFDQPVEDGGRTTSVLVPQEHPVLPHDRRSARRALPGVVGDREATVRHVARERLPLQG